MELTVRLAGLQIEPPRALDPPEGVCSHSWRMVDRGMEVEAGAEERHRYKIFTILPSDKRVGRPKRELKQSWDDITAVDLAALRRLVEPKLQPNQIAELDGRTVARGSEVSQAEADESEVLEVSAPPAAAGPAEISDFAQKVCWDAYIRARNASVELRAQEQALTERTIEQGKRIDAMISELQALRLELLRQGAPSAAARISMDDLKNLVTLGVTVARDVLKSGPEKP